MKCVVLLLDGLGDRSQAVLKYRTPLEAARTTTLDRIAAKSACGLYHSTMAGEPMPSEIAHLIMFGYERNDYPGRGYLEALGSGIDIRKNDIALLAHLACVEEVNCTLVLKESRPGCSAEECEKLISKANSLFPGGNSIQFIQTGMHDGILVVKGASPSVTDSDPLDPGMPLIRVKPLTSRRGDKRAEETAKRLNRFIEATRDALEKDEVNAERRKKGLPVINCVLTQRAGAPRTVPSFESLYGMKAAVIGSGRVYGGISRYTGMDFIKDSDTGSPGEDFARRIDLAVKNLENYDFIHVHTKGPDEAAHKHDPLLKKKVIEELDSAIGKTAGPLLKNREVLLVVAADHSTPSSGRLIHSGEPVPLMIHGESVRRDRVKRFDEVNAASGSLGFIRGKEFILTIINALDRARLGGLADDPDVPAFSPGNYEPFRAGKKR